MKISLCNEVLGAMRFEEQCELAARLGYDGLEIAPYTLGETLEMINAMEARRLRGVVESCGLVVTGLHWLLVRPAGLSLTDPDPAVRARTLEVVKRLIALCAELGGSVLVHGSPKQRAVAPGESLATAKGRLSEFLAAAAQVAAEYGVTYCIEPLGRAETPLINTVAEAAEIVRAIDNPALRTMIDCSAAGSTEAQPVPELIDTWLPTGLIAHIQVNDPNRRAPGQGEMRFAPIFAALRRNGYDADGRGRAVRLRPRRPGRRRVRGRLPARRARIARLIAPRLHESTSMATRRLGLIMHGVTGRMGMNQHLIRSIVAIRAQGGVALANGDKVMPDPILIGRNAEKIEALAKANGIARWGTDLDAALADKNDTIFFDAGTTQMRPMLLAKALARRQARLLREADRDQPERSRRDRPRRAGLGPQARRGAGQAVPARPEKARHAAPRRLLRPHAERARSSSATGSSKATCSRSSGPRGTTAPRTAAA